MQTLFSENIENSSYFKGYNSKNPFASNEPR